MSNEYKDWMLDRAQDYVLENENIIKILSTTIWDDGYLIIAIRSNGQKCSYFVWLDDAFGWCSKFIC